MDRETVIRRFENLRVWKKGDKTAPHKPLLVLYAIGSLLKGKSRLHKYSDIDKILENLLSEFSSTGPPQGTDHPFCRLQTDEIWKVIGADEIDVKDQEYPSKADLIAYNVRGGFTEEVFNLLKTETDLAFEIVQKILDIHFSPELHAKILYWTWIDSTGPRAS